MNDLMQIELEKCIAHTPNSDNEWDYLLKHLSDVGEKAYRFAFDFGSGDIAYNLGILHDLGKINPEFQNYLNHISKGGISPKVPHSIWGAALIYYIMQKSGDLWKEFVLPIAGHHSKLDSGGVISLKITEFINNNPKALELLRQAANQIKPRNIQIPPKDKSQRDIFIRMLYSTLVDADYLMTERHFKKEQYEKRGQFPEIKQLWHCFEKNQKALLNKAKENLTEVNQIRRKVYDECIRASNNTSKIFRLTVPTGGGKTRSSLAFALKHAIQYGLKRIIVALPYTSIIDQTAKEYRKILGNESILEHHSQLSIEDNEEQSPSSICRRLASENWDAPIIVTTTVQLFESLFNNHPGRVRKIHNIAKSVIILDEVQTLPTQYLRPTLDLLRILVKDYGVTIVLSTATQPTFDNTPYLSEFREITIKEIVPDYADHFDKLKRVEYQILDGSLSWTNLAKQICSLPQVMVIMNTRVNAISLMDVMKNDGNLYHLSTLLCGAHRKVIIDEIKERLLDNLPVRLISTQVVEAGVDLDFPVVYRAIGPLDRIVQAAGRCNREGKIPEKGMMFIFEPEEGGVPRGPYHIGLELAKTILSRHKPEDLHNPDIYREYFQGLFSEVNLDEKNIQELRENLNFPEIAEKYKLIDQKTIPVIVNYDESLKFLKEWQDYPSQSAWRKIQPYLINLYQNQIKKYEEEGWIHQISEGLYQWLERYDERRGIIADALDPSDLVISESNRG